MILNALVIHPTNEARSALRFLQRLRNLQRPPHSKLIAPHLVAAQQQQLPQTNDKKLILKSKKMSNQKLNKLTKKM